MTMRARGVPILFLALLALTPSPSLFAAPDRTEPTTPVVTDDGAYTSSTTTLHASWTSSDPESGIADNQYLITQDSPTGTVIVNWISTGTTQSVTRSGLALQH